MSWREGEEEERAHIVHAICCSCCCRPSPIIGLSPSVDPRRKTTRSHVCIRTDVWYVIGGDSLRRVTWESARVGISGVGVDGGSWAATGEIVVQDGVSTPLNKLQ